MTKTITTITADDVAKAIRAANESMFGDPMYADYGVPTFTDQAEVDRFVALKVEMIDQVELSSGVAWVAKVTDGDWSFDVENGGRGGCNTYRGDYGSTERFADAIYPDDCEALDGLVNAVDVYLIGRSIVG